MLESLIISIHIFYVFVCGQSMYKVRGDHIYSVDAPQKARLSLARGVCGGITCSCSHMYYLL